MPGENVQPLFDRDKLIDFLLSSFLRNLKSKPTRRSKIYDEFVAFYIDREVRKSLGRRGTIPPDALSFEAMEFSRQLAIFMASRGLTKLSQKVVSDVEASAFSHFAHLSLFVLC